jgi:hypothetical protein
MVTPLQKFLKEREIYTEHFTFLHRTTKSNNYRATYFF